MPKLFQISSDVNVFSIGKIAESIGQCAQIKGWESYITYCRNGGGQSKSKTIKIGSRIDNYWHGVMTRLFDRHCLHSTRATSKLIKTIKDINPDIIHLHHIHGYFLDMRVLCDYLKTAGKPVVWTFHDCWSFTGHCAHFISVNCDRWKKEGCHDCPLKGSYPKSYIDRSRKNYILKKKLFTSIPNLHIITVSDWLASFTKESFFRNTDVRVINNGVNIDIFKPYNNKRKGKYLILGAATTWTQGKGLYDFFELRKRLPQDRYDITLVGLSKSQVKDLPEGINGLMRTDSAIELAKLYSEANVFLNPTYADSFPTVNIEALACGTPVITYRTGGSPEIIDEKTGIVVDQGDVEGLICAIKQLESNPLLCEDCRKRAVNRYDKDKCFEEYISLYESLLD